VGYGIVLWLDHSGLDAVSDESLGAALVEAVGTTSYPGGDVGALECGPWHRVGSWHSSQSVEVVLGVPVADGGTSTFDRTWSMGECSTWIKGRGRGAAPATGPMAPVVAGGSSAWWLYADCIEALGVEDLGSLGAGVRAALCERVGGTVTVGSWCNAMNCAGRFDGVIGLYWEGNRLWDREAVGSI
jgi:hypothetical protein